MMSWAAGLSEDIKEFETPLLRLMSLMPCVFYVTEGSGCKSPEHLLRGCVSSYTRAVAALVPDHRGPGCSWTKYDLINMTNLQENLSSNEGKKEHVERNWFSDLMLLQIESIPAGYNEVTAMYKHLARNNNPSVSPRLTKLPFPDDATPQIKASSLHHVCPQLKWSRCSVTSFPN